MPSGQLIPKLTLSKQDGHGLCHRDWKLSGTKFSKKLLCLRLQVFCLQLLILVKTFDKQKHSCRHLRDGTTSFENDHLLVTCARACTSESASTSASASARASAKKGVQELTRDMIASYSSHRTFLELGILVPSIETLCSKNNLPKWAESEISLSPEYLKLLMLVSVPH